MSEGPIESYLSAVRAMWPSSPEPRLRRSRGSGPSSRETTAFLVLPHPQTPRMLVPADNRWAAARSMRRFSAGLSASETIKRLGVAAALRGLGPAAFPHRIEVPGGADSADSLTSWLAEVLAEPVTFSVGLGTARVNRKPVLHVFDRRGRSLAFAKVATSPLAESHVAREVEALTTLHQRGAPAPLEVPRLLHVGRWQGALVLVMSVLEPRMWHRPSRQWRPPSATMSALHGHFAGEPLALTDTPLWSAMDGAASSLRSAQTRDRLRGALQRLADLHGDQEVRPGAWHGDWTPWNMAHGRGGRVQLWDWERFELGVPAGLDRCHYAVNAVCRRDGVSTQSIFSGLRLAAEVSSSGGREHSVSAAAYLAAITCRYLVGAESELGTTIQRRSGVSLDALDTFLEAGTR